MKLPFNCNGYNHAISFPSCFLCFSCPCVFCVSHVLSYLVSCRPLWQWTSQPPWIVCSNDICFVLFFKYLIKYLLCPGITTCLPACQINHLYLQLCSAHTASPLSSSMLQPPTASPFSAAVWTPFNRHYHTRLCLINLLHLTFVLSRVLL